MGRTKDLGAPPWSGPGWNDLNVAKNCSLYGHYASWLIDGNEEPPFPTVFGFWRTVFPDNDATSDADITKWHGWVRDHRDDLLDGVAKQLSKAPACRRELCLSVDVKVPQLWWLAAFGIPAALIMLYYIMAALRFFRQRRPLHLSGKNSQTASNQQSRFLEAFSSTSDLLFLTATIVNLAVGTSTLLRVNSAPRYDSDWLIFVVTMSFFLLASTLPLVIPAMNRGWLKGGVYILLFILSTAAWAIGFSLSEQSFMDDSQQFRNDICPYLLPHLEAIQAAVFTTAGMVWMPPLFGICVSVVLCFYRCSNNAMWQATWVNLISKMACVFYGTVNLISLLGSWVTLFVYARMIPEGKQDAWGLEQILASAIWAPVLVMLIYHIIAPNGNSLPTAGQHNGILNEKGIEDEGEALLAPEYEPKA